MKAAFARGNQLFGHQCSLLISGLMPVAAIWAATFALIVLPNWVATAALVYLIAAVAASLVCGYLRQLTIRRNRRALCKFGETQTGDPRNPGDRR